MGPLCFKLVGTNSVLPERLFSFIFFGVDGVEG